MLKKREKRLGPEPLRVKFDMPFHEAAERIVKKKKPRDGWPDLETPEKEAAQQGEPK